MTTERTTCRVCDSTLLQSVLDLGNQPLANRLLTDEQLEWQEPDFPLHMVRCATCGHCQLTHVVDPKVLYHDYPYASGHSEGWHQHSKALAQEIGEKYPGGNVLDIAANDCTLLSYCRDRGLDPYGVEPARNLDGGDIPVCRDFWSAQVARTVPGPFSVIVAQNVFGHVDDARGFMEGAALALKADGTFIIECPWSLDLLRFCRWDTIYHEHVSYWGVMPLWRLAKQVGLRVAHVRCFPRLHGGTVRYYLRRDTGIATEAVHALSWAECQLPRGLLSEFEPAVAVQLNYWRKYFAETTKAVAGYGASAKSSTFLNALPERPTMVGIFDDAPQKQGLYTPGWHFPILKPTADTMAAAEELISFAPNWPLEEKAAALGFRGDVRALWRP